MPFFKSLHELIQHHALKRVLLAFSGGPDSQALLHTLLKSSLEIGIAHVDHGWREESCEEAEQLRSQIEALSLPFYLKRLQCPKQGNLENISREERYQFFKEICSKHGYQAVFLAHTQDDQAETVLKRVLEGASLAALGGMQKSSDFSGLLILRPFLDIPKKKLLDLLQKENIPFIQDPTNRDTRFLRAKMRETILPDLNHQFGKSVQGPLVHLAKECRELEHFLQKRFSNLINQEGLIDLSAIETPFEVRWILSRWLKKQNIFASRQALDQMTEAVFAKKRSKSFLERVTIDQGRVYADYKGRTSSN